MPGLVPGIHALLSMNKTWMAGTSPAMTDEGLGWRFYFRRSLRSAAMSLAQAFSVAAAIAR
jgi:hypothetical protein